MRRLIPTLLIAITVIFSLALLIVDPTAAQEPAPPPKGSDYSPPTPSPSNQSAAPPASIAQIPLALRAKINPQLLKRLLTEPDAPLIVYLTTKTDLKNVVTGLKAQGQNDKLTKRQGIINALQQTASKSQGGVIQLLTDSAKAGGLDGQSATTTDINSFWIVNAVAARASLNTVLALAARSDVEFIQLDKTIAISRPSQPGGLDFSTGKDGRSPLAPCASSAPYFCVANDFYPTPALQATSWGINRIRADFVHNALQIDGSGIVVANIDTGVDWQHQALQHKYRGFTGAGHLPQHQGNWHDATDDGATYPVDGRGHGTHTMGTMVGDGLGVAPGARWIAVKAFNSEGLAQTSWLHDAFQWLLAPAGDPALAPDIVNNSWGNPVGGNSEFEADIQALLNAGIFPVFSAGNNGPDASTVGSPGSLDVAFSVGAVTPNDETALFSSRGPSPWGRTKPEVSAPGVDITSTFPGGSYIDFNGTSMAAPHVAGLAALLLQAEPSLGGDLAGITYAITSTATPLGEGYPNNDYGWGLIDAYNAVMSVTSAGTLQGAVTKAGSGASLNQALIQITPRGGGPTIATYSDAAGVYQQGLAAGRYDVTTSAFGYQSVTNLGLDVITSTVTLQDFALPLAPKGTLQGVVRDSNTGLPLEATITVDGTPASTTSTPTDGRYSLTLPVGNYNITVVAPNHRIGKAANITINDGGIVVQDFLLAQAPTILLVDSGWWSQDSELAFYQQALAGNLYNYSIWQVTRPITMPDSIPSASTLANFDIVIWSSPYDAPGFVGADEALVEYLEGGGKLFLSGQDVAFFDGGGSVFSIASYFKDYLKARYVTDDAELEEIRGLSDGPLAGLTLTIAAGDGADNQFASDIIAINDRDFAGPLTVYGQDGNFPGNDLAGLHVGVCVPYRAMYLSFGFEAINNPTDRQQVMQRALDWLVASPTLHKVELTPETETRIGNFNTVVDHQIRVRNTGLQDDAYNLSVNSNWPLKPAPPSTLSIPSCETQVITVGVQINTNAWHTSDTLTLEAQSLNQPAIRDVATRTTKSPAPILLVDDDRFISFASEFQEALAANNFASDFIQIPKSWQGEMPPSPPLEILNMYPVVVWYTAYDWFQPLVASEEEKLSAYLEGGGRLFFSSQDYIYNLPEKTPEIFAQTYLGVQSHIEDFRSATTTGRKGNLIGNHFGPYDLEFPLSYQNNTDLLTPTTTAEVITLGDEGQANGVMNSGDGAGRGPWRTVFLAFGPELLQDGGHAKMMQRAVGWLSWLGTSKVEPHVSTALDGETITYTVSLTNDGWSDISTAYFTATIPAELTLNAVDPQLTLSNGSLVWNGPLAKDQNVSFVFSGTIADPLPLGTALHQTNWLYYPEHDLLFDRVATVYVNFPDFQGSALTVTPAQDALPGETLTYTIVLKNSGLVDDPQVTAANVLPHMLILDSVDTPSGGSVLSDGRQAITWTTPLAVNETATLTYRAVISYRTSTPIDNMVLVTDNITDPVRLRARTTFKVYPLYFPIIYKN